MAEVTKDLINQGKPWRSDVKWQIVAAEAVILVALGIFMLVNTGRAGEWILGIIGIVILVAGLQLALGSFRMPERGLGVFDSFRAGVGVTIGAIATVMGWGTGENISTVRDILGWGLLAYAALQLAGILISRKKENFRPVTLLLSGLVLVLAIALLTSNEAVASGRITFLGWIMLVCGVVLAGLAYLIKSRDTQPA